MIKIFLKALFVSRPWDIGYSAEWMYRLNVYARSIGRVPMRSEIYAVKNKLIKYLYQHGYSYEVTLQKQNRECWYCDRGKMWDDSDCPRCDGSGIYSVIKLYSFRFKIGERYFSWHQLEKLIDFPVTLLEAEEIELKSDELRRDAGILTTESAWLGICIIWWALLFRGHVARLQYFRNIRILAGHYLREARMKLLSVDADDDIPF